MRTKEQIRERLEIMKNWEYIYGFKRSDNPVKASTIDALTKLYPSTFTASYTAKSKSFIGMNAIDCSGLVCDAWGIQDINSASIRKLPTTKPFEYYSMEININLPYGSCLWKDGHVGIYIGNGKVRESRGIDYGVVDTNLFERGWMLAIVPKALYESNYYENIGWNQDSKGWWHCTGYNKGDYLKSGIHNVGGDDYYFDDNGYCKRLIFGDNGNIIDMEYVK